ncbi:MAG: response regulator [Candidatus Margulisbacteria bacterium]|nr:response regulator [Candidatus Margulisiibacteriota bacterium]
MTKKILLIEDYEPTAKMIEDVLKIAGYEMSTAINGISGLQKVTEEKPGLILLDIMLPGIDGLEVCKRLKADPATAKIPVIAVSVKSSAEDIKKGLAAGVDEYVTKPFDPQQLIEVIKQRI